MSETVTPAAPAKAPSGLVASAASALAAVKAATSKSLSVVETALTAAVQAQAADLAAAAVHIGASAEISALSTAIGPAASSIIGKAEAEMSAAKVLVVRDVALTVILQRNPRKMAFAPTGKCAR
jgi:hypothetical protein